MEVKATFKSPMFVYSVENIYSPSILKVAVPEAFLENTGKATSNVIHKGNPSLFINATIPALSNTVTSYNYINVTVATSVGRVRKGDRFVAEFINGNPEYGYIIARC